MVGGSKRKITQTAVINIFLLGTVVGFTAGFELQLLMSRQDVSDEGFYILKCCERPDFKKKTLFWPILCILCAGKAIYV